MAEPEKVARRLAGQVDERRHPRTTATVDHLLDRHFELVTLERSTLVTYLGYVDKTWSQDRTCRYVILRP